MLKMLEWRCKGGGKLKMKFNKKLLLLIAFLFNFSLSYSEKLKFEGEFEGEINYAEKMGGFASEMRELEIIANRIVQKDAEIKYYQLMLQKANMKLQTAIKSANEDKTDEAIQDLKSASTDLAMFSKNFVTNYRLIGNYQDQMESLLKGNDMFGSGGNQYEIVSEQANMLKDMTRTLDKMGNILEKDSKEYYKLMFRDKSKAGAKKDEMTSTLRNEAKTFANTLGKFYENSAILSKIILDEVQNDNIKRLLVLKIKREALIAHLDKTKELYEFYGYNYLKDRVKKDEEYRKLLNNMGKSGIKR